MTASFLHASMACLRLVAGGCPAATHFSLSRQRKVSKRKATLLSASLRFAAGNLRCSVQPGSSSNSPSAQTIARPDPSGPALLGAYRRVGRKQYGGKTPEHQKRAALLMRESQRTLMFARERSTRGRMLSPSIAPRGEGGARGGSGESGLLSQTDPFGSVQHSETQSACLRRKAGISKSSMPPDASASTLAAAWVRLVRQTLGTAMLP